MPLASTVKLLIAIEFAQQSAHEMINENSYAKLADIEKFYIANTDGGAHPAWLEYAKTHNEIKDGQVKLVDVARGMMMFSSNANADYLMDKLGFDSVIITKSDNQNFKIDIMKTNTYNEFNQDEE